MSQLIQAYLQTYMDLKLVGTYLRTFLLQVFLKVVDVVIFTSKSEHKIISNLYRDFNSKFVHQSFSIDTDFWSTTIIKSEHKEGVIVYWQ